jgi:hypothetical protein
LHAFPILGERPVAAIDQALINDCVSAIWTTTPETARRTRDRIERVCQWVKDGMPLPRSNGNGKKHHPALPWQEVPAFVADLRQRSSVSARALEFLTLAASISLNSTSLNCTAKSRAFERIAPHPPSSASRAPTTTPSGKHSPTGPKPIATPA